MGNNIKSCESNVKLKKKQYPTSVTENDWKPVQDLSNSKEDKEVIVSQNGDQRIRATPDDYKNNLQKNVYNIGRLKMEYIQDINKSVYGLGTASIINHKLNETYLLTAAHNVVDIDIYDNNKLIYPDHIWFEINENTLNNGFKTLSRYKCVHCYIHPTYIKYLKKKNKFPESATGYDIAIIKIIDNTNTLNKIKSFKLRSYKSSTISDYKNIKVIGFPGEMSLRGQLYGMKGNCNIGYINNKIQINKLILYDNIDTSKGQSGSPIFNISDGNNDDNDQKYDNDNIYKSFNEIIGVHVSGKPNKKCNFGTLINDNILEWIYKIIDADLVKYNDYDCCALLITSSKIKYEKSLNKIYKKLKKTNAFNTIRLYYDYNDNDCVNNINKEDILKYIQNMFNDKIKRKSLLIYYCGESDQNGDWIINNYHDVITLNDIHQLYKTKTNKANNLFIVSDCCQSGNWVQQNKSNYSNDIRIQASSQNDKPCKPGIFSEKYAQVCFGWWPSSDLNKLQTGTAVLATGVAALTIGTLYDGVIKQPYHLATKQSQPTTTSGGIVFMNLGLSYDGLYVVRILTYDSWYVMDFKMTAISGGTVGSGGATGFY